MKPTFFFILLFLAIFSKVFASDSLVLIKRVPLTARLFATDPIGNIYVITGNNALVKYNAKGDSIGFFNEIKKGKIVQLDASNPLRILLYYSDYGNILVLDNVLSLKSTIKLNSLGLVNVPCIANSADGSIWVSDPAGLLLKINNKPEINFTTSLRNVLEKAIDPLYMTEYDRSLYIVDSTEGIFKFDQFGLFKTRYPFHTRELQLFNSYLVYYEAPYLISFNTLTFQENKIMLPNVEDIKQVRVERNVLYILGNTSLDIYSLDTKNGQ
ncbi:MAG: hypothetical protein IPJ31_00325 [Bacteroidetes bacterium]|nr:hypothetical protein [Bacteroidota bacterium]